MQTNKTSSEDDSAKDGEGTTQASAFTSLHLPNPNHLIADQSSGNFMLPFPGTTVFRVMSFSAKISTDPHPSAHYVNPNYLITQIPPYEWCIQHPIDPRHINKLSTTVEPRGEGNKSSVTTNDVPNNNNNNNNNNNASSLKHPIDNSELTKTKQQTPTKPSVIPTTKFIYETLPKKKKKTRKTIAEKLPDPGVLIQYELNQKSVALDIGCSETMVSQWINGTTKPTGWSDFEARIRTWLSQEHKKPEKGTSYDFIDESTKIKSKFKHKSNK